MKTKYYCQKCEIYFDHDDVTNINKQHFCGEVARVLEFDEGEKPAEEKQ